MATKKMTKREMYEQILAHTTDKAEQEFLKHELELLTEYNVLFIYFDIRLSCCGK